MVGVIVAGLGVKQNGETVAVEHQPGHETRQHFGRKRDLIHRLWMRTDQFIVPAAELGLRKFSSNTLAQAFRTIAALRRFVIDMNVIIYDVGWTGHCDAPYLRHAPYLALTIILPNLS